MQFLFPICVRVTQVSSELDDWDDRNELPAGHGGSGSSKLYRIPDSVREHVCEVAENSILDWFHSTVPIGCLDDFEIECVQVNADEAEQAASV